MKLSSEQIQIIQTFFQDKPVKKVYVFGSYARGDADEKSDIDLLIDWDYSQYIGLKYVRYQRELNELFGKKVDFVSADWVSKGIEPFINHDKVLMYEKPTS
ncbi:nucleotidyltransferase domain-containing protein [Flavobacterium filum]|uniref:nucleotidyltransferase family protein n=1 Tax=Flavobacterium filum TaxID=370974 RepID=UPI0023F0FAAA|nr:nucleotidyltransferase domain-containing protein [Flavobacterium filum]